MHSDQLRIESSTVRRLIDEQFPQWRRESVEELVTTGTTSAIFRVGDELSARFPLQAEDVQAAEKRLEAEAQASSEFAANANVGTPLVVAIGSPGFGYPMPWSLQTWVPGRVTTPSEFAYSHSFAGDVAALIDRLRATDVGNRQFAGLGRGGSLTDHDEWVERCFRESEELLDLAPLRRLWRELRELPAPGREVMSHGDLIPGNLLVHDERLVGVLDAGGFGPADPGLDLVCAWHLFESTARGVLRRSLGCGDVEWLRGKAWAFQQAIGLVWYYRRSNPGMSDLGRSTLTRIVSG